MRLVLGSAVCVLLLAAATDLRAQDRQPDGAGLYREHCASCHDNGAARAPDREALRAMQPKRVIDALETGQMISMATGLSVA
jgi:mono/diheme cytochrome c family protein